MKRKKSDNSFNAGAVFGPAGLEVEPQRVVVDGMLCSTFVVAGYPREVRRGWLEPLLSCEHAVDVSVHVDPMESGLAATRLRKQMARLESSRRANAQHGRLIDFDVQAAADDAAELASNLARGDTRLFRVGIAVTVRAMAEETLNAAISQVKAILSSLLADVRPMTFRSLQGWRSTLPLAIDETGLRRTFDTAALAATFPFAPAELSDANGVLYGKSLRGASLVFWDRFGLDNHNSVILARSGAGKSYLAKLEILRSLYRGIEVSVIDPEDEYRRLCETVDGVHLDLGAHGVRLNPFDLGPGSDALTRQVLFLHTFVGLLLQTTIAGREQAVLDQALLACYREKGITTDPATHCKEAPTLSDLDQALRIGNGEGLADRLSPFVTGSFSSVFNGTTTRLPNGHLVVYSLRQLPDELKGAATMIVLDRIWQQVSDPATRKRRLVTVDEAWLLMRDPQGAKFLFRLAKAARKYWCGLTVITQDAADLLGTELGQAIVANAATQILLRQSPQAIDRLAQSFKLSEGERAVLLSARPGEGIIAAASQRIAFRTEASPKEHALVTTNPAELHNGSSS